MDIRDFAKELEKRTLKFAVQIIRLSIILLSVKNNYNRLESLILGILGNFGNLGIRWIHHQALPLAHYQHSMHKIIR